MKTRIFSLLIINILLAACGMNEPIRDSVIPTIAPQAEVEIEAIVPTLPQPAQTANESDINVVDTNAANIESAIEISEPAEVAVEDQAEMMCDTSAFLDVQPDPANSAYAAPSLNVFCEGESMIIESNGIPNYEFVQITPGGLSAQTHRWEIPLSPQIADETTAIPLLGTVGFAVNGLPIYGPNEAANLGWGDPILDEVLDFCNGHTAGQGDYHYHGRPDCLFADWEGNTALIIGYSLDGFPILSPYICEDDTCSSIRKVESSWQRTQDVTAAWDAHEYIAGSGDLDQCNGLVLADGSYAYFATDTFPYIQACYTGTPSASVNGNGPGNGGDRQGGQVDQGGQEGGGQQGNQEGRGDRQGPDLAIAAAELGVTEDALRNALVGRPPDFAAAAATLGISEDALRDAIGPPPGR